MLRVTMFGQSGGEFPARTFPWQARWVAGPLLLSVLTLLMLLPGCSDVKERGEGELALGRLSAYFFGAVRDDDFNDWHKLISQMAAGKAEFVDQFFHQMRRCDVSGDGQVWRLGYRHGLTYYDTTYHDVFCRWDSGGWRATRRVFLVAVTQDEDPRDEDRLLGRFEAMASIEWPGTMGPMNVQGVYVDDMGPDALDIRVRVKFIGGGDGHEEHQELGRPEFRVTFDGKKFEWQDLIDANGRHEIGDLPEPYDQVKTWTCHR